MERLQKLRKEKGLRQIDFARRFGIPKQTVNTWEQGHHEPPEWVKRLLIQLLEEDWQPKK